MSYRLRRREAVADTKKEVLSKIFDVHQVRTYQHVPHSRSFVSFSTDCQVLGRAPPGPQVQALDRST